MSLPLQSNTHRLTLRIPVEADMACSPDGLVRELEPSSTICVLGPRCQPGVFVAHDSRSGRASPQQRDRDQPDSRQNDARRAADVRRKKDFFFSTKQEFGESHRLTTLAAKEWEDANCPRAHCTSRESNYNNMTLDPVWLKQHAKGCGEGGASLPCRF